MSVTADKASRGFVRLQIDGEDRLAVRISGHTRSMAGQLQSLRRDHGWIVKGDRIEAWEVSGLIEHEGAIFAYGSFRENTPFMEPVEGDPRAAMERLGELASALATLRARSIDPGKYEPEFILKLADDGLLVLPEKIVEGILSTQTERERVAGYDPFNHPDFKGERNACFFIGVLAYRALTGKLPYIADSSEELHQRIRQQQILPPHLALPGVREELSELVMHSFDLEHSVSLQQWQEELARCRREGFLEEISDEERERARESAEKLLKSAESGYQRRVFLRRNWRTIAIVAGIVVIVGAIGGSIIKNALKPRITVGMTAEQVVNLFYTSITTFNNQAMQDCVIDGAGKAAITEATNLYVISRVREGYQGSTGYVPAQKWIDAGKPKLPPGNSVYGVADLKIAADGPGVFTVNYEKWQPYEPPNAGGPPQNPNQPVLMQVQGYQHVDKVYLKNEGKFWAIYRIDHVTAKKIGEPITITNPQAKSTPPGSERQPVPVGAGV